MQRAIINSRCEGATDEEARLAEQAGEPTLQIQPGPLFDYRVTWLWTLVGVIVTFAAGASLALLLRRTGGPSVRSSERVLR